MPEIDSLRLRFGSSERLRVIQIIAAFLGALAIVISPAGLVWKLGALSALALVTKWAQASSTRKNRSGWLDLLQDGTAHLKFDDGEKSLALLKENAWAMRWFCVLALFEPESGRNYHYVVCASVNTADEFRRLLKFLNMRTSTTTLQKARWW